MFYFYWVTPKLPQIYTANHATFPIRIRKITVQICGNFWVTQYYTDSVSYLLISIFLWYQGRIYMISLWPQRAFGPLILQGVWPSPWTLPLSASVFGDNHRLILPIIKRLEEIKLKDYTSWPKSYRKSVLRFCVSVLGR